MIDIFQVGCLPTRPALQVMQPAVAQLFHMERDAPQLYLSPCGKEVLALGSYAFGEVPPSGTRARKRPTDHRPAFVFSLSYQSLSFSMFLDYLKIWHEPSYLSSTCKSFETFSRFLLLQLHTRRRGCGHGAAPFSRGRVRRCGDVRRRAALRSPPGAEAGVLWGVGIFGIDLAVNPRSGGGCSGCATVRRCFCFIRKPNGESMFEAPAVGSTAQTPVLWYLCNGARGPRARCSVTEQRTRAANFL